jgi:hypothetical protein
MGIHSYPNSILAPFSVAVFFLLTSLLFLTAVPGQQSEAVYELDPGVTVAVDLNKRTRLDFYAGREKSDVLVSGDWKIGVAASLRVKPLFKRFLDALDTDKQHALVLGTAYEYSVASETGVTKPINKILFDATVRWAFKEKFLLSNRNRLEFMWVSKDFHFRLRERFKLERPVNVSLKIIKREISPFIVAEAIWDHKYSGWGEFKYGGGVQIPLFKRTTLDLSYQRFHCVPCLYRNTNILDVAFHIYLHRKKK